MSGAPTQASNTLVMPASLMASIAVRITFKRSCSVSWGTVCSTNAIADSRKVPDGAPNSSRSMTPEGGVAVVAEIFAIWSKTVLTATECPSEARSNIGRSSAIALSQSSRGPDASKKARLSPSATNQDDVDAARHPFSMASVVSRSGALATSHPTRLRPPIKVCRCASWKPGNTIFPSVLITRVAGVR